VIGILGNTPCCQAEREVAGTSVYYDAAMREVNNNRKHDLRSASVRGGAERDRG